MNKLKDSKGITLLALTITIIVMMILSGTLIISTNNQLKIKKVNNLYSDIELLNNKVSEYYIKNKTLPIKGEYANADEVKTILKTNGAKNTENLLDVSDKLGEEKTYYVIDLTKLDNLTLNYGRKYSEWESGTSLQDLYIINIKSHKIYYPKGVKIDNELYYSYNLNLKANDSLTQYNTGLIPNVKVSNLNFENTLEDSVIYIAKSGIAKLNVKFLVTVPNNNELKDTYYAFTKDNTENKKFIRCNFNKDSSNSDQILYNGEFKSEDLEAGKYYLWLKFEDKYGNEFITQKSINDKENEITNQIEIKESEINLNVTSTEVDKKEILIKFNPNAFEEMYYGEGETLEDAKNNCKMISNSVSYDENTDTGERQYTLVVQKDEYVFVYGKDIFGNITSTYVLIDI